MNVRCPSCETLYRVDPAKVPEQGIRALCAECPAVISIVSTPPGDLSTGIQAGHTAPPQVTATSMPPPLVAAEQPGAEIATPPVSIPPAMAEEIPPVPDVALEDVEEQLPDIPEPAEAFDEALAPDLPEPIDFTEPAPPFEAPAAYQTPVTDEVPPLEEVSSPTEPVADHESPFDDIPPVPEVPESPVSEDIVIPAPEPEPEVRPEPVARPPLEVMPSSTDAAQAQPRRRYTRPFIKPPQEVEPPKQSAPSGPLRPTAPVFRPTPGMPIQQQQPDSAATVEPVDSPPAAELPITPEPTQEAPVQSVAPETKPRRPVNPFLSKDPKQKARRLARALVSDMIVYQPQKRQEALAAGTLKQAFDEEIKKSWEEYVDQIGVELANSTAFFREALNDILAGGNEVF